MIGPDFDSARCLFKDAMDSSAIANLQYKAGSWIKVLGRQLQQLKSGVLLKIKQPINNWFSYTSSDSF